MIVRKGYKYIIEPNKKNTKNITDVLFFKPKNIICSIALKNHNIDIKSSNELPRLVLNISCAWNRDM